MAMLLISLSVHILFRKKNNNQDLVNFLPRMTEGQSSPLFKLQYNLLLPRFLIIEFSCDNIFNYQQSQPKAADANKGIKQIGTVVFVIGNIHDYTWLRFCNCFIKQDDS